MAEEEKKSSEVPENPCILCWIEREKFNAVKAAAFVLGEAIKYPHATEPRFADLCDKHAKVAHKMGNYSAG